jgi:drug/metabolite transporter (DMT)-like permease
MSALSITTWTTITGTPGVLLAGLPGIARLNLANVSVIGWGGLAYATLLSLVVAYLLWNRGIQALGASRTALFTCLTPLVATSIAMIVGGVVLSQAGRGKREAWSGKR